MDDDIYSPRVENVPTNTSTEEAKNPINKMGAGAVDFIQTLVVFGAIFAIIYLFIAQPHKVSGLSMYPNFNNGDYILTDKVSYRFGLPTDGDVIVLKNPQDESQDFIKRVMATPGQVIKVAGNQIYRNDSLLDEKYLPIGTPTRAGNFLHEGQEFTVPVDHYLVFGDNREHSSDSRTWGLITKTEIIGKVIFRYFPLNTIGIIKNGNS